MKASLFLGFFLLVGIVLPVEAASAPANFFSDVLGTQLMRGEFKHASFSRARFDCPSPGNHRNQQDETQLTQRQDAAVSVSIFTDTDAALILLAVIALSQRDLFLTTPAPPKQSIFFDVLFNSIISPNAP